MLFLLVAGSLSMNCTQYIEFNETTDNGTYYREINLIAGQPYCARFQKGFFVIGENSQDLTIEGTGLNKTQDAIGAYKEGGGDFEIISNENQSATIFYDFEKSVKNSTHIINNYIIFNQHFKANITAVKANNLTIDTKLDFIARKGVNVTKLTLQPELTINDDNVTTSLSKPSIWAYFNPNESSETFYYRGEFESFVEKEETEEEDWYGPSKLPHSRVFQFTKDEILTVFSPSTYIEQYDENATLINDFGNSSDYKVYKDLAMEDLNYFRVIDLTEGQTLKYEFPHGFFILGHSNQQFSIKGVNVNGELIQGPFDTEDVLGAAPIRYQSGFFQIKSLTNQTTTLIFEFYVPYEKVYYKNGEKYTEVRDDYIVFKKDFVGTQTSYFGDTRSYQTLINVINPFNSTLTITSRGNNTNTDLNDLYFYEDGEYHYEYSNSSNTPYAWNYNELINESDVQNRLAKTTYTIHADKVPENWPDKFIQIPENQVITKGVKGTYIKRYDETGAEVTHMFLKNCKSFPTYEELIKQYNELYYKTISVRKDDELCYQFPTGFFAIGHKKQDLLIEVVNENSSTSSSLTKDGVGAIPYSGQTGFYRIVANSDQNITIYYDFYLSYSFKKNNLTGRYETLNDYVVLKKNMKAKTTGYLDSSKNITTIINVLNPFNSTVKITSIGTDTNATLNEKEVTELSSPNVYMYINPKDKSKSKYHLQANFTVSADNVPEHYLDKVLKFYYENQILSVTAVNYTIDEYDENGNLITGGGNLPGGLAGYVIALIIIGGVFVVCAIVGVIFCLLSKKDDESDKIQA